MTTRRWTRRAVLAALPLGATALSASHASAQAQAGTRFRSVSVDTSRLAGQGLPQTAAEIHDRLARELAEVFADLMAPRDGAAPTLVARIESFSLASYAGNEFGIQGGTADNDYLEGAGLVVAGGQVLSTIPVLSALAASYSGAWYLPDIDARRIASITHHFAYWLRRGMDL